MMKLYRIILVSMLFLSALASCDVNNFCEQNTDSNLTLFLQNRTTYAPLPGANCSVDVWDSNKIKLTDDGSVNEDQAGWYYYTLSGSETSSEGLYYTLWNCSHGSYVSYAPSDYEIIVSKPNTMIYEILGYITNSTSVLYDNMLNYLQGQLETTLSQNTLIQIAQSTWNATIVEDREITADPGCKNRPWFDAETGLWGTEC